MFSCVSSVLASRSIHDASFGRHFCIRCVSTDNMAFRCNAVFYLDAALFSALYVCVSGVPTRISSYTWQNGLNVSREIMLASKTSMPAAITHSSWSMLLTDDYISASKIANFNFLQVSVGIHALDQFV